MYVCMYVTAEGEKRKEERLCLGLTKRARSATLKKKRRKESLRMNAIGNSP